jgi:hypothetical protein
MKCALAIATFAAALSLAPWASAADYTAALSGPAENPSNSSPGIGFTTVTLDVPTHTLHVVVSFSGLTAGTTASHIHCCTSPPGNAGVATAVPTFPGFPLGATAGNYDQVFDTTQAATWNPAFITANGGTPAGAEAALAAGLGAGRAYLNIHTTAYPGGEIRGFLAAVGSTATGAATDIPGPTGWSVAALAAMIAAITLWLWRRRGASRS